MRVSDIKVHTGKPWMRGPYYQSCAVELLGGNDDDSGLGLRHQVGNGLKPDPPQEAEL
jgi:hypothetical protein